MPVMPPQTCLALFVSDGFRTTQYTAFTLGNSRWGLCLTLPQILDQTYTLPVNTKLHVQYVAGTIPVQFETYVLGYQQTTPPMMIVAEPREFQRRERRRAMRIQLELPVSYVTVIGDKSGERTTTIDLGTGGLAMLTEQDIPVGASVRVFLSLLTETLVLPGRISWSGFRGRVRAAGVEFLGMDEKAEQSLACFLFAMERQLGSKRDKNKANGSDCRLL